MTAIEGQSSAMPQIGISYSAVGSINQIVGVIYGSIQVLKPDT
jgi:hypothetical protein